MKIWQVAAGDGSRDYADVFLKFGVILVGPGSEGDYFSNKEAYNNTESEASRPFMQVIAEKMSKGDMVILKRPHGSEWEIVAVGEVASDYLYCEIFGDVDGWDLRHCRKIKWKTPSGPMFISGLRRGTLAAVNNQLPIDEANKIWSVGTEIIAEDIPPDSEEISVDQLIDSLIVQGLPGQSAEVIANTIWRLRRIAKWYSSHGSEVGEHEIRTFLIAPLLTSVGWAEQKIKIEWNNIDIAIFDSPYHRTSNPSVIIESKRLFDGLRYAPDQAQEYAHSYPTCSSFIVSDGIRYKLYKKINDVWLYSAYMNLLAPKHKHPYYKDVEGAGSFFLSIMPKGAI